MVVTCQGVCMDAIYYNGKPIGGGVYCIARSRVGNTIIEVSDRNDQLYQRTSL